ncbi:AraC family transcriptional regulator [Paenibacillus glycanilyticus]|uniref:helix-turn-helix domain-containing protein n=1 Tax=Paenibacillus glycanilyticus TaxID=126569 RepID=UPI00203D2602|nr:AraC family transcriptional regulator [Paenibacillus glycanilyticus]MCM3627036.1 AraC family transcriptional regulator [Paenibacillus glycanilyticus]
MKTLILVDDEAINHGQLPWNKRNCKIIGKASNGEEALELVRRLLPDISLIEIKLPVVDEQSLLHKLGDSANNLIVTAHRDLVDVGTAGAVQYPLRKYFLKQLLSRVYEEDNEITTQAKALGIHLESDAFVMILGQIDGLGPFLDAYSEKDHHLVENSMLDVIRDSLQLLFPEQFELFPLEFGKFSILLLQEPAQSQEESRNKCLQLERAIAAPLRSYLNLSVTLAVSSRLSSPSMIREGYKQAERLFIHRFYKESSHSIFADQVPEFHPLTEALQLELNVLAVSLRYEAESAPAQKSLNSIFALLLLYRPEPEEVYAWLQSLESFLRQDSSLPEWPAFGQAERLAEAIELLRVWLRERDAATAGTATVRAEIARALDYIHRHIADKLTINDIALEAGLSPSHFSLLFKKELGKSAIDYVLERRIELAKHYLSEGRFRNYELAEKVGFSHYSYFSNTFKNYTGMRPNEYKRSLRTKVTL